MNRLPARRFALAVTAALALVASMPARAQACSAPNPDAKGLFDLIADGGSGTTERVQAYLSRHIVAVDALNEACETPLQAAIHAGLFDVFHFLYDNYSHPDVNAVPTGTSGSLYDYALFYGDFPVIQFLKSVGGAVVHGEDGDTDLMIAAQHTNRPSVIEALIRTGSPVNAATKDGHTALIFAATSNTNPAIVDALIRAGAELNVTEQCADDESINCGTALMHAVQSNANVDVIRALIRAGANLNAANAGGLTAVMLATLSTDPVRLSVLLEAGASAGAATKNGLTALMLAVAKNMSLDTVNSLIAAGAPVNAADAKGSTALMIAVSDKDRDAALELSYVQALLRAGAQVNATDEETRTPLLRAMLTRADVSVVRALIEGGAMVNYATTKDGVFYTQAQSGVTALMIAAGVSKTPEVVAELIRAGASVNAVTSAGATALMTSATNNPNVPVTQALLDAGADPTLRSEGLNAYDCAKQANNTKVAELLYGVMNPDPQPQPPAPQHHRSGD